MEFRNHSFFALSGQVVGNPCNLGGQVQKRNDDLLLPAQRTSPSLIRIGPAQLDRVVYAVAAQRPTTS